MGIRVTRGRWGWGIGAGGILVVLVGGMVGRWMFPGPVVVLSSDSPDGWYRVVISERVPEPRGVMQSPYMYEINLVDPATGKAVPGTGMQGGYDSCAVLPKDMRVIWRGNTAAVTLPGWSERKGEVIGGRQVWK